MFFFLVFSFVPFSGNPVPFWDKLNINTHSPMISVISWTHHHLHWFIYCLRCWSSNPGHRKLHPHPFVLFWDYSSLNWPGRPLPAAGMNLPFALQFLPRIRGFLILFAFLPIISNKLFWAWWCIPNNPSRYEAEAGELLQIQGQAGLQWLQGQFELNSKTMFQKKQGREI